MKVTFINDPVLVPHGNKDGWMLYEDFFVRLDTESADDSLTLRIPKGFITDLASVPKLPVIFLMYEGKARRSAIVHDYLYELQYPKEWCDSVFYAAMDNEVSDRDQYAMWLAVHLGGHAAWSNGIPFPQLTKD